MLLIAFIGAELVEVKQVGTENKIMRQLLDFHVGIGSKLVQLDRCIGLAIGFDVLVDAGLHLVIPSLPIAFTHGITVLIGKGLCHRGFIFPNSFLLTLGT